MYRDQFSKGGTVTLCVADRLRRIVVGRTYAGSYVLLVQDLGVTVVHATTGELPRQLTLNYQPRT